MKLYYSTAACSLAPHIALSEAGLPYDVARVDLKKHQLADGTDYYAINPKGYVPLLELDDGTRLSEVAVILQYIADRKPGTLAPASARWSAIDSWSGSTSSRPSCTSSSARCGIRSRPRRRRTRRAKLATRFELIAKTLDAQPYLTGSTFTVADAYLFTILNWAPMLKVDLAPWPALQQFQARVAARPAVHAVLVAEGLVKKQVAAA